MGAGGDVGALACCEAFGDALGGVFAEVFADTFAGVFVGTARSLPPSCGAGVGDV